MECLDAAEVLKTAMLELTFYIMVNSSPKIQSILICFFDKAKKESKKFSNFCDSPQRAKFRSSFFRSCSLLKYSNKSMIVKVAGRAMMSLLCSVHLLCSDEQVFLRCCALASRERSWSSTASIQSYALRAR